YRLNRTGRNACATTDAMDFSLNDHQKLIRDTVRQFMEAEVRSFVKEWEKAEKFPSEAIKKLGEMGCCGMLVPEEWGGPGLDTVDTAAEDREDGRARPVQHVMCRRGDYHHNTQTARPPPR